MCYLKDHTTTSITGAVPHYLRNITFEKKNKHWNADKISNTDL